MAMFVDKCVYASLYDMWYASLMPCFLMQNIMLNIYAYVTCYATICESICKLYVTWYASYACDFMHAKYLVLCMLSIWFYAC